MKKVICLLLIFTILFSFSACGDNTNTTIQYTENTPSTNTTNKIYSVGETWIENEWEFTINAVYTHNICSKYSFDKYGSKPVVVIDYTYKNIGFSNAGSYTKLEFNHTCFDIYDANGFSALDAMACTHCAEEKECVIGTSCRAQQAFIMESNADISKIIISVENYKNDIDITYGNKGSATFEIPVTQQDIFDSSSTIDNSNSNNNMWNDSGSANNSNTSSHTHLFLDSTCLAPRTCKICGETKGSIGNHDWEYATCTKPKTCKICGVTSGTTRTHNTKSATCTEPKTCEDCGVTMGLAKGHRWKAATCTEAEKCTVCGVENSKSLGHDFSGTECVRCHIVNPNFKPFSLGETWVVDGEWEIKFNSVKTHYPCNHYDPGQGQVLIINYTYKNLGYSLNGLDLQVNSLDMTVYDANGEAYCDMYACTHTKDAKKCIVGMSCTAEEAYVFSEETSEIIISIDMHTTNDGRRKATFKLKF